MAKRIGRPSKLTEVIATTICQRLAEGESLRRICSDEGMPSKSTVLLWAQKDPAFSDRYARAREMQMEHWSEEIIEIADDGTNDFMDQKNKDGEVVGEVVNHEHITRSRLRVDTRKWLMSKLYPRKYGDRVVNEMTGANGGPIETRDVSDAEMVDRLLGLAMSAGVSTH